MSGKVKVSKAIYDSIESYGKTGGIGWYNSVLLDVAREKQGYTSNTPAIVLSNEFTLYELAEVLVKGYEIEYTHEERIEMFIEWLDTYNENIPYPTKNSSYRRGRRNTLESIWDKLDELGLVKDGKLDELESDIDEYAPNPNELF